MNNFKPKRIVVGAVVFVILMCMFVALMMAGVYRVLPENTWLPIVGMIALVVGTVITCILIIGWDNIEYIFAGEWIPNAKAWWKKNTLLKIVTTVVIVVITSWGLYTGMNAYLRWQDSKSIEFRVNIYHPENKPIKDAIVTVSNLFDEFEGSAVMNPEGEATGSIRFFNNPWGRFTAKIQWGSQIATYYDKFPFFHDVGITKLNIYLPTQETDVYFCSKDDQGNKSDWTLLGTSNNGLMSDYFLKRQIAIIKTVCNGIEKEKDVYINEYNIDFIDVDMTK